MQHHAAPNRDNNFILILVYINRIKYYRKKWNSSTFARPWSDSPVLFKASLIFKDFSRKPFIFKYFSSLCEPCKISNIFKGKYLSVRRPLAYLADTKAWNFIRIVWAVTWDFQQCYILTWMDSNEPVQPPFKLRDSKWCSVSSSIFIEYSSD